MAQVKIIAPQTREAEHLRVAAYVTTVKNALVRLNQSLRRFSLIRI